VQVPELQGFGSTEIWRDLRCWEVRLCVESSYLRVIYCFYRVLHARNAEEWVAVRDLQGQCLVEPLAQRRGRGRERHLGHAGLW
jgi:hypothetical protein